MSGTRDLTEAEGDVLRQSLLQAGALPTYTARHPRDTRSRQEIRDAATARIITRAVAEAGVYGCGIKCSEGRHVTAPQGCANDGTTCLCACHDRAG